LAVIYSSPRPGTVKVDGETFNEKDIIWEIDGIEYTADARQDTRDVQWPIYMAAVIKVKKKGGLAAGEHEVSVAYRCIMSHRPQ